MKSILILAALLAATPASADPLTKSQRLNMMLRDVGRNYAFDAFWIDAMPRIAEVCDMKLVKAQFFNVANTFRGADDIEGGVRMLMAKPEKNVLFSEIEALDDDGMHNQSCVVANRLWGDEGEMLPGVLSIR